MLGMNQDISYLAEMALAERASHQPDRSVLAVRAAAGAFSRARRRGRLLGLWGALMGRPQRLLDLHSVSRQWALQGEHYQGIRAVPIKQIRGSEGRHHDFDLAFNPLQDHTRERWLGIVMARGRGTPLPPVSLIQVEDSYFVRDGHHRISVAAAMGQETIDAEVVVWHVARRPVPELSLATAQA